MFKHLFKSLITQVHVDNFIVSKIKYSLKINFNSKFQKYITMESISSVTIQQGYQENKKWRKIKKFLSIQQQEGVNLRILTPGGK